MFSRLTLLTNPDRCNLRCPACFLQQTGRTFGMGEMPWETAERALRAFALQGGREVIPSTIGEPLLYTHFEKLANLVRELNLKMNLTTNGTFPKTGVFRSPEDWARLLLPVCRDIKISLMGYSASVNEKLMKGTNQLRLLDSIARLTALRDEQRACGKNVSAVSLQVMLCRKNLHEVPAILSFAQKIKADRVKWNRVFFLKEAGTGFYAEYALPENVSEVQELIRGTPGILMEGNFLPSKETGKQGCPFLGKELWILPDGSTEPCPNPERRFGKTALNRSLCSECLLK